MVVAGVDGTRASWRAACYAIGLATRGQCGIALAYVQELRALPLHLTAPPAEVPLEPDLAPDLLKQARTALDQIGPRPPAWEFHVLRGDPARQIAALADELKADAVVVGRSGSRSGRGSVGFRLIRSARWPLIVVP